MNSAYRASVRRPHSAGAQVNLNKVSNVHTAPRWTVRGKPTTSPANPGGALSRPASASRLEVTPGPGQYSPEVVCKGPRTTFLCGQARRGGPSRPETPGPADYQASVAAKRAIDNELPQCTFGKEVRMRHADSNSSTLGPAKYDLPSDWDDHKGLKGRMMSMPLLPPGSANESPGPGDYVLPRPPRAGRGGAPCWGGPPSRRRSHRADGRGCGGGPGPGQYDPGWWLLPRKPAHSIAGPRKASIGTATPGPANLTYTQFAWDEETNTRKGKQQDALEWSESQEGPELMKQKALNNRSPV